MLYHWTMPFGATQKAKTAFLLHVNTRCDRCSSLACFSLVELLVVQQAKKTEWASSCVHNQNTEHGCKMSFQLHDRAGLRVDRWSQCAQYRTIRESTRIFVVTVRMRSHKLDFYSWFCFCWGGGGGQSVTSKCLRQCTQQVFEEFDAHFTCLLALVSIRILSHQVVPALCISLLK